MAIFLLVVLVALWLMGLIQIPGISSLNVQLFELFGKSISLMDILIFGAIIWAIGILPSPFRQIAAVIALIWLLSFFGFIAVAGLSNILVLILIIGLVLSVLKII
ncbi:MAG: hypothetical protein ABIO02_00515 [Patescibacteria group bacterium]